MADTVSTLRIDTSVPGLRRTPASLGHRRLVFFDVPSRESLVIRRHIVWVDAVWPSVELTDA